ncbi:transglutaminase family protein [Winogradskyella aurantia]|uniref:Transglutaminase n=1 Tax=Winogradskyella aurantia TaxID=1915063 RepID=A0A265UT49_9FLAO|nr:transglutaminase family protein [Winogradskyella aurantia]OZV68470.1 transglutaminase [Winogradskyella aurantia]
MEVAKTYKITHQTQYIFDSDVFLEPHYLRFRPKETAFLKNLEFSLELNPKPAGHRIIEDENHALVDFCWFEGLTNQFTISAQSVVNTVDYNPFNFILYPTRYNQLPFQYSEKQKKLLGSALEHLPISKDLMAFGNAIQQSAKNNTLDYISNLTKQVHQDFKVVYREEGAPMHPNETFELKKGSCRDLSWMLIHLLRQQGMAARFVSGYFYFEMDKPGYELHAWVDLYLPGAGWLGVDPSHGILTGNSHFPVASSTHYDDTMPVFGGIRGSATSQLITNLSIELV